MPEQPNYQAASRKNQSNIENTDWNVGGDVQVGGDAHDTGKPAGQDSQFIVDGRQGPLQGGPMTDAPQQDELNSLHNEQHGNGGASGLKEHVST